MPLSGQTSKTGRITEGTLTNRPATCTNGDFYATTDTYVLYQCGPNNVWVSIVGSSTFTGGTVTGPSTFLSTVTLNGENSTGNVGLKAANTNTIRYVTGTNIALPSGNGSDSNDGLSIGTGLADIYSAIESLDNASVGYGGGFIYLIQQAGGEVLSVPSTFFSAPVAFGVNILGPIDINFVATTGSVRNGSGSVTATALAVQGSGVPGIPTSGLTLSQWQSTHVYSAGAKIIGNGFFQITTAGGTSGSSFPAFNPLYTGTTSDGTVTWINSGIVALSPYYQTGNYLSVFSCVDPTYDASKLLITGVTGTTITYNQNGAGGSTTGCIIAPLGFAPQVSGSYAIKCAAGPSPGGTGSTGPTCFVAGPQYATHVNITAISQSGNLVSVTHDGADNFFPGVPVRILNTPSTASTYSYAGGAPTAATYSYDQFTPVYQRVDATHFTVINPLSGLTSCSSSCGITDIEEPGMWFAGTSFSDIDGLNIQAGIPVFIGDSNGNPANQSGGTSSQLGVGGNGGFIHWENDVLNTFGQGFPDVIWGPTFWEGGGNVWGGWFDHVAFSANTMAPVNSDQRANLLIDQSFDGYPGLVSGIIQMNYPGFTGGGGVRVKNFGYGSWSFNMTAGIQEGTIQCQPFLDILSSAAGGTLSGSVSYSGTADCVESPPAVRMPFNMGIGPAGFTVTQTGGASRVAVEGPATVINTTPTSQTYTPYNGTSPLISPQAMGQQGIQARKVIGVDEDSARFNFPPGGQRFTNLAAANQDRSTWTVLAGTSVTMTPVAGPGPDPNNNLGTLLQCTAVGTDYPVNDCAVQVSSTSMTINPGDYLKFDAYEQPGNHSAGQFAQYEVALSCRSANCTSGFTPYYSFAAFGTPLIGFSSAGSTPYWAAGNSADDGAYQHVFGWWKQPLQTNGFEPISGSPVTVTMEFHFSPTNPMKVAFPGYSHISTGQVQPPAAPSISQSAAGSLAATHYYVRTTYVTATGETDVQSTDTVFSASANNVITVAAPGAPSVGTATLYNVYAGNDATCDPFPGQAPRPGDITGPGDVCETKQNATPISTASPWVEPTSGLVAAFFYPLAYYAGGYGPAGQTEPTWDTTNSIGDSAMSIYGLTANSAPALYTSTGLMVQSERAITGTGTLSGGTLTVTFTGAGIFTGSGTYACSAQDTTTPANAVTGAPSSGTQVVFTGTGTDAFTYSCSGS